MKSLIILSVLVTSVICYCGSKKEMNIEVLQRPPEQVVVELGETVSIACSAHGHSNSDPLVYWVKGVGVRHDKKRGKRVPVTGVGKAVLYIAEVEAEDIDSYRCVIEDCCTGEEIDIDIEIIVPDKTCEDVYGIGHVVFGATWKFLTWPDAIADCAAKGLEMALPVTEEENAQLLHDLVASFENHPNARKFAHENYCWLGATDQETEGVWRRAQGDEVLDYVNWDRKQPDNKGVQAGQPPVTQNVAGIHRGTGKWDDSYVYYKRPYACLCPKE